MARRVCSAESTVTVKSGGSAVKFAVKLAGPFITTLCGLPVPLGPPLISTYGTAGSHATTTYWIYLAIFTAVFFAAAWITLDRTCRRHHR